MDLGRNDRRGKDLRFNGESKYSEKRDRSTNENLRRG